MKKPTQEDKILNVLEKTGDFVSGRYFLHDMYLSQYHARIWDLQQKGYNIIASQDVDSFGFKSYKLIPKGNLF